MWAREENKSLTPKCRDRLYIPTAKTKPRQTYENVGIRRFAESSNRATTWRVIPCDSFLSACIIRLYAYSSVGSELVIVLVIIEQPPAHRRMPNCNSNSETNRFNATTNQSSPTTTANRFIRYRLSNKYSKCDWHAKESNPRPRAFQDERFIQLHYRDVYKVSFSHLHIPWLPDFNSRATHGCRTLPLPQSTPPSWRFDFSFLSLHRHYPMEGRL